MISRVLRLVPLSLFALTGCGVTVLSSPAEVVPEPTYAPSPTYVQVDGPTYVAPPARARTQAPRYTAAEPDPHVRARTVSRVPAPAARPPARPAPPVRVVATVTDRPVTPSPIHPTAPPLHERQGLKTVRDRPRSTQSPPSVEQRRPEVRVPLRDRALPKRAEL